MIDSNTANDHDDDDDDYYLNPDKDTEYQQKWTTRYLLSMEALNIEPHQAFGFRYEHGAFDIPFQSDQYRSWVGH